MQKHALNISEEYLRDFCRRFQIVELAVFGSVLRADFGPESDVDFLVTYAPDKQREAWGRFSEQEELEALLGRKVDWITRKSVAQCRNPIFRREVFATAETIYAE